MAAGAVTPVARGLSQRRRRSRAGHHRHPSGSRATSSSVEEIALPGAIGRPGSGRHPLGLGAGARVDTRIDCTVAVAPGGVKRLTSDSLARIGVPMPDETPREKDRDPARVHARARSEATPCAVCRMTRIATDPVIRRLQRSRKAVAASSAMIAFQSAMRSGVASGACTAMERAKLGMSVPLRTAMPRP